MSNLNADPELQALLRAILDAPGDDLPRLVYADWLEENGEMDHAEFIRVGCQLAQTDYPDLRKRERELLGRMHHSGTVNQIAWAKAGTHNLVDYKLTRGFVSEIRCTFAAFVGGACDNCEGTGEVIEPMGPCPDCGGGFESREGPGDRGYYPGTGTTPGIAAAVFREHPVTAVVLTDREPRPNSADANGASVDWWGWYVVEELALRERYDLPASFDHYLGPKQGESRWRRYPSREAALDALSAACVAYGRAIAFPPEQTPFGTVVGHFDGLTMVRLT